ncbi:hypothetical protein KCU87_g518, partial [Aureobasidium melanogenum]
MTNCEPPLIDRLQITVRGSRQTGRKEIQIEQRIAGMLFLCADPTASPCMKSAESDSAAATTSVSSPELTAYNSFSFNISLLVYLGNFKRLIQVLAGSEAKQWSTRSRSHEFEHFASFCVGKLEHGLPEELDGGVFLAIIANLVDSVVLGWIMLDSPTIIPVNKSVCAVGYELVLDGFRLTIRQGNRAVDCEVCTPVCNIARIVLQAHQSLVQFLVEIAQIVD